ncbi:MAG: ATP-binding protein, partial [Acidimicrobiia bacterium]|nr:ATP-binding protein [Acidimicrobiia bacterium]
VNALQHGGPEVRVGLEVSNGDAIVEVNDNGPGVPPEIRDRLFEPFVNDAGRALLTGSLGMGLSVAASLATLLGGDLRYRRTDRTSFTLRLPAAVERRTEDVLSHEVTTV